MVLTGPVKSGKTDVLRLVLPSMIAREHSLGGRPRPFIFHFTFDCRQTPELAAATLVDAVKAAAARVGIKVHVEPGLGWALRNVSRVLSDFANALVSMKAELWLLLDECQVCEMVHPQVQSLGCATSCMLKCRIPYLISKQLTMDSAGRERS